jgi:hypothetical protein
MLIEVFEKWVKTPRYKYKGVRQIRMLVQCDACGKIEEISFNKAYYTRFRCCSPECDSLLRKRGGLLYNKIVSTNIEWYGETFASKTEECKEKSKKTNIEKYGYEHTGQVPEFREKVKETCRERYGGDAPTCSPVVQAKVQQTLLERYGGGIYLDKNIKEHFNNTMIKLYGAPWAAQCPEILHKQHLTNIEKYGCAIPFHTEQAKLNAKSSEAKQKRHQTMKNNKTYSTSKPEEECYRLLCLKFDEQDIERQKTLFKWPIDFYVKSINTYVQFDGIYWHGLDRDIEIIKEFKNPRDKVIYRKYCNDQEQNKYAQDNNIKLIRVTSIQELKQQFNIRQEI